MENQRQFNFNPIRIRRDTNDDFFDEYREQNEQTKQFISYSNITEFDDYEEQKCQIKGCNEILKSQESYNNHYNLIHKHVCMECNQIYPSSHLLDIHLTESHDSYFQLKSIKENSYRCLVETCVEVFATWKERHKHVIKSHNFPSDFRFESKNRKKIEKIVENVVEMTEIEDKNQMDVEEPLKTSNSKIPNSICFGKGSNRGFQRRKKVIKQ